MSKLLHSSIDMNTDNTSHEEEKANYDTRMSQYRTAYALIKLR